MPGLQDLGGLSVTLTAIEARWNQSMDNAKKQLGDVDTKLGHVTKASLLMRTAFTVAGAAVAGALVRMTLAAAKLGETIQNNTKLTGTSTREFTELAYAARTVDVDMAGLADAIKEANENTSKAATGAEKQAIAIRAIGASVEELQRMTPAQRFERIAEGISELRDEGDRARVALDLLGGSGVRLLPLLSEGAVGVRKLREEAVAMGQSFSQEQIDKLANASDAVDRLKESWHGLGMVLASNVAPVLTDVLNLMSGDPFKKFGNKLGTLQEQLQYHKNALDMNKGTGSPEWIRENEMAIARINGQLNRRAGGGPGPRAGGGRQGAVGMKQATAESDAAKELAEAEKQAAAKRVKDNKDSAQQILDDTGAFYADMIALSNGYIADEKDADGERTVSIMEAERDRNAAEDAARAERFEALRQQVMTEEELEAEKYKGLLELLNSYTAEEIDTLGGHRAAVEKLEQDHIDRVKEIRSRGLTELEKFNEMSWSQQVDTVSGELVRMTAGVATHNKKLFELNKIAAIANATVSVAAGITKALEVYPPPLSFAMAAAQAAAGAAQIAAIKNAKFGGGTAPSQAATPATPVAPRSAQTIAISGISSDAFFSGSQIRSLLEKLQGALNDGGQLVFDH